MNRETVADNREPWNRETVADNRETVEPWNRGRQPWNRETVADNRETVEPWNRGRQPWNRHTVASKHSSVKLSKPWNREPGNRGETSTVTVVTVARLTVTSAPTLPFWQGQIPKKTLS